MNISAATAKQTLTNAKDEIVMLMEEQAEEPVIVKLVRL